MFSTVIKKILRSSISDLICKGVSPKFYFISGSGNKKTKESITIRITTKELEKKPAQSVFKSFIKMGLQKRVIGNPKSIDYRIYDVSGFPDGLYKKDRKITNIIFSYIKESRW